MDTIRKLLGTLLAGVGLTVSAATPLTITDLNTYAGDPAEWTLQKMLTLLSNSQSGIATTNFSSFATAFNIYCVPVSVTNLAPNKIGATNTVVSLTGSTSNNATATTWTYVSHTTTTVPNSFSLYIFASAPTDPTYASPDSPAPPFTAADWLKNPQIVTFTNTDFRTVGTNSVAKVNANVVLSPTNWIVRVCEQARTNAGTTPIDTVIVSGYKDGR